MKFINVCKNKALLAGGAVLSPIAMSFAQESGGTSFPETEYVDFLSDMRDGLETGVNSLLGELGSFATIGLVIFFAVTAFYLVKRFLRRP